MGGLQTVREDRGEMDGPLIYIMEICFAHRGSFSPENVAEDCTVTIRSAGVIVSDGLLLEGERENAQLGYEKRKFAISIVMV